MKIGVSGHRQRTGADWDWVRDALVDLFLDHPRAMGWSSLAVGADQIFAEVASAYGAGHVAVIPGAAYEDTFTGRDLKKYQCLRAQSKRLMRITGAADEEGFRKAGEKVVRCVDLMVLVWDGAPARGVGGTGEIAAYAEARNVPSMILNPIAKTAHTL